MRVLSNYLQQSPKDVGTLNHVRQIEAGKPTLPVLWGWLDGFPGILPDSSFYFDL
jgi:hypothetical protein